MRSTCELIGDFLHHHDQHEVSFGSGCANLQLIKSSYDKETDFLYLLTSYDAASPHRIDGDAEFAGIYSRIHQKIYMPGFRLAEILTDAVTQKELLDTFKEQVRQAILERVKAGPVAETEEAEQTWITKESYLQYTLSREALHLFYKRQEPTYEPGCLCESMTTAQWVGAINHSDETAAAIADAYIRQRAKHINQRLWEVEQLRKELQRLEHEPGLHHVKRAIIESIPEKAKTVNVWFCKDGHEMRIKMEASAFRRMSETDYSTYYFDAPSRRAFEAMFGKKASLELQDILQIQYGWNTLFDIANVQQPMGG